MFFVVHKKWMRHRNTLPATSTYSIDQLSSLTHWLHSPRPPSPASLFIIYSCVCSAQVSANPPALLTPDKSFAFIFIFHASTLTAFVLDLLSWKDEKQGKKINVSLNSLSLMWLYIDNSYLFFIPLILHQLLEKMYSSLKRCFLSMCLLVLSACSAVGVWYHEECRSKFGVRRSDVITYQWLGCRFVKSLPQFIEVTFLQTSQRRFLAR